MSAAALPVANSYAALSPGNAAHRVPRSARSERPAEFYKAKIQTAEFYYAKLLPRAQAHAAGMLAPTKTMMQMENDHFAFS